VRRIPFYKFIWTLKARRWANFCKISHILYNPFPHSFRFDIETEGVFMAMPEAHAPDRRAVPRRKVHLDCQVIFEGNEYDAVIQDISVMGAFLWSSFMPAHDSAVSLRLKPSHMKPLVILKGTVVRRDSKYREHGKAGAFAIVFKNNPPNLLQLLGSIINPQDRQT
jgi:hypothetical protein